MQSEADRIDLLISELTGNNAREFAERTSISPKAVSLLRHGKIRADKYRSRIIAAFPEVNKEWLITGEGETGIPKRMSPADYEAKIERLEGIVDTLIEEVRIMQAMVKRLTKVK